MKNWLAAGAIALTAGMTTTVAQAQTTTVPGEQVGLAVGAPLPEGIYAINTFTYRSPDGPDAISVDTAVNVPILVWATPSCRSAAASNSSWPPDRVHLQPRCWRP
nr:hypothetical protein [Methylorubrum aminovorans]